MVAALIRMAKAADRAAVEAVVRAAYSPYLGRIGREPGPMLDDYGALIADGQVHVAGRDGAVEAVLVLLPQADAMLLDNVAVAPGAQGTGLGRQMMAFAEAQAVAAGFRTIRLYTHQLMVENIGIYVRRGYAETHRATEKGLDRVYMEKPLR